MEFLIDTTEKGLLKLGLITDNQKVAKYQMKTEKQSEDIFQAIEYFLSENNMKLGEIELIWVNSGPGPFTATRTGVTVANALAFALGIDVAQYPGGQRKKMIEPIYDKEPNITIKKDVRN